MPIYVHSIQLYICTCRHFGPSFFLLVAKFGTENAASPTIHNGFRNPVEIPGNFFGRYARWSHDWTPKKWHRSPYVWSHGETHGKFQATWPRREEGGENIHKFGPEPWLPTSSDAVRKVETFPPEFYWVEYVSSMNLCFFEWDVSSARCAELKITSLLIFPTQLIEICCSTLPVNLCWDDCSHWSDSLTIQTLQILDWNDVGCPC